MLGRTTRRCTRDLYKLCTRDTSPGQQSLRYTSSVTRLTPLHDLEREELQRGSVSVTLADNPGVIVCHHPPTQVSYSLTRAAKPAPAPLANITLQQTDTAVQLMTESPLVWNSPGTIADMFHVCPRSVEEALSPVLSVETWNKCNDSHRILSTWSKPDRDAFSSYQTVVRLETRNKLLSQHPALFKFCDFSREEELVKLKLYSLQSESPQIE